MQPLIGTAELADLLAGPAPPVLLDVRWSLVGPPGPESYAAGHLPGAVFTDLDRDLAAPAGPGGRHPLPDPRRLQAALRRLGVRTDRPVVAYDLDDGSAAARAWWLLRWAGHDEVAVLDGGYAAWSAEGRPVTVGAAAPADVPGDITVRPGGMPVLDAAEAAELAGGGTDGGTGGGRDDGGVGSAGGAGGAGRAGGGVLLDARASQRFAGEVEPIDPVAGHIPGARNLPATELVGADGRWLAPAELAERLAGLGVRPGAPVGAYCGSGVTACALVLAVERAGLATRTRPAALYAGSWSHWCTDPSRPVATGPLP